MEPTTPEPAPETTGQPSGAEPALTDTSANTSADTPTDTPANTAAGASALDLGSLMDLSFGPSWAKKPPSAGFKESPGRFRPERPDRDRRSATAFGGRGKPPMRGGGQKPFPPRSRPAERPEPAYEPPPPPLPVHTSLLPHQKALSGVIREISLSRKAFPVAEVVSLFLNREDACEVKVEVHRDAEDLWIYQCKICRLIATDRSLIARHIQAAHLEEYFEKVETLTDPPSGQFSCVARCGFTGTLLGPPNHHCYAENIREIHSARFPEMPLETYTQAIQTVRDPALIEQWKEESRKQVAYRRKDQNPEAPEPPLRRAAAESWMLEHAAAEAILKARRAIMPKSLSWDVRDRGLARAIKDSWNREKRYPASLLFALRGAFRHRNLHVFKAPEGAAHVTAVEPTPLAAEHLVDSIRELFKCMEQRRRCRREDLVKSLRPEAAVDSPEAAQLLAPLAWLIDKGHIIEFADGSLSLPLPLEPRSAQEPLQEPAQEPAQEVEQAVERETPQEPLQGLAQELAKPSPQDPPGNPPAANSAQGAANATSP